MTYKEIRKNEEVRAYLKKGNENLGVLGFTDHSEVHCALVAERAAYILKKLDYTEHDIELAKIAGIMHDIGNAINRKQHAEYGALLAGEILKKTDMSLEDRVTVMSAIGHHDESAGGATDVGADIFERGCCLPSDNKMTEQDQAKVIEIIKSCFN